MRLIARVSLLIQLAVAQITLKSCVYNEFCVHLSNCPMYKPYISMAFKDWPAEVRKTVQNKRCNRRIIRGQTVNSICCPSVMNSQTCGVQTDDRISNGEVAKPFEFPWMALLRDVNGKFVCGGTLISSRYVLTAAHCVKRGQIVSVRLGENDITKKKDCNIPEENRDCAPTPQNIKVIRTIGHKNYSDRYKKNDIALLRLQRPATLGESVRTICLPSRTKTQRAAKPSFLIISGWGLTEKNMPSDVLRYAKVPSVSLEDCAPRIKYLNPLLTLDGSHVCAGGVDKVDNCPGDSGGPLQYFSNQTYKYIQYGIVSFGVKTCGEVSEPGVYTKVEHFIDWIIGHVDE